MLFLCLYNWGSIHTVICSMRIALVASVSCSRLFMCSMLRVVVFSFSLNSSLVGSTVHTNGSRDITNATYRRWYNTLNSVTTQSLHLFFSPKHSHSLFIVTLIIISCWIGHLCSPFVNWMCFFFFCGPLLSNTPCLGSGDVRSCSREGRDVGAGEKLSVSVVSMPSPSSLAIDCRSLRATGPTPAWFWSVFLRCGSDASGLRLDWTATESEWV